MFHNEKELTAMKKIHMMLIALVLVLLLLPALASAEMVSITKLREQAEAMDGRWQKTYETPNGALEVDIPIVIP